MQNLSKRLQMVYRSVPANSAVADIGTDHAFLPIALMAGGRARSVLACDVAEGPLAVAKRNIEKSGIKGIELRLTNGLNGISPTEVDVVTIAGMGGDLIARILQAAPWVKSQEKLLILQAMTSADSLRDYLYAEGFDILNESAVTDSGRVYSVITARYSGEPVIPTPAQRLVGMLPLDASDDATEYIKIQLKRISACAESLSRVERKQAEYKNALAAKEQLIQILNNR